MKKFVCLLLLAVCSLSAGCNDKELMQKFIPAGAELTAKGNIDLLRQGKFDEIEKDLDQSAAQADVRDTLVKMAAVFPPGEPDSVKVVGAHTFRGPEYTRTEITLEYQFSNKWLLATVVTQKTGSASALFGFHVNPQTDSLESLNRFTLVGKGPLHLMMLSLAAASFLFSLYSLVLCLRTRNVKWKWAWVFLVLLGVGKCTINWTTGQFAFQLIAFQIPCFVMARGLYGPWIVGPFVPLGAILFLNHRWKMKISGEMLPPPAHPIQSPANLD